MRRTRRPPPVAAVLTALVAIAACGTTSATTTPRPRATGRATSAAPASGAASTTRAAPTTDAPRPDPGVLRRSEARIARLTASLGRRGVSIAAVDTADGVRFAYGARHGMLCASIAKLYILETVLLQQQRSGQPLGDAQQDQATRMIENSDNDAADDLYTHIGEGAGLLRAAGPLGVRDTTPGSGSYWGYTRTGASSYLALLRDLTGHGPLDPASRHLALHLLSHVGDDQRWGVGSVADAGSTPYLKNGWLAVSTDAGRWAVNTVGIVTVHGRKLFMVVMTQHGGSFVGGVDLVDRLAGLAARVVTAR